MIQFNHFKSDPSFWYHSWDAIYFMIVSSVFLCVYNKIEILITQTPLKESIHRIEWICHHWYATAYHDMLFIKKRVLKAGISMVSSETYLTITKTNHIYSQNHGIIHFSFWCHFSINEAWNAIIKPYQSLLPWSSCLSIPRLICLLVAPFFGPSIHN